MTSGSTFCSLSSACARLAAARSIVSCPPDCNSMAVSSSAMLDWSGTVPGEIAACRMLTLTYTAADAAKHLIMMKFHTTLHHLRHHPAAMNILSRSADRARHTHPRALFHECIQRICHPPSLEEVFHDHCCKTFNLSSAWYTTRRHFVRAAAVCYNACSDNRNFESTSLCRNCQIVFGSAGTHKLVCDL